MLFRSGYTIRLDDLTSAKTRIRFVTEGVLVRQMISRPKLEGVQAVICDEFHERHLYGDLTLGRILELQETQRPDLILVVMSATLETEKLAQSIGAEVLRSDGRMFPVETEYLAKREDLSGSGVAEVAAQPLKFLQVLLQETPYFILLEVLVQHLKSHLAHKLLLRFLQLVVQQEQEVVLVVRVGLEVMVI